jgi:Protein of unknown function (DUF2752)
MRPAFATQDVSLHAAELRAPAAVMLVAGALLPLLPADVGFTCPLRAMTGIPCPLCGMTTSVEATVHFDLGAALAANPAGVAVVAVALLALLGRPKHVRIPALAVPLVLAAMWVFELARFSVL